MSADFLLSFPRLFAPQNYPDMPEASFAVIAR
jgi:hypothetical protein